MTVAARGLRHELRVGDEESVRRLVASTGFFSADEVDIAVELVAERRARGDQSGYHFVFLDEDTEGGARTVGYTCYGLIAATRNSYDLYWIAVDAQAQRSGHGRFLLHATEARIASSGEARIYVETSSRPQYAPTRAFYERCGYRREAELADFYGPGDGKVIYCKVVAGGAAPQLPSVSSSP